MLVFVYCPIWFQIIKHETYCSMEYNVLACCKKVLPPFHNYCSVSKYGHRHLVIWCSEFYAISIGLNLKRNTSSNVHLETLQ